jgi:hypothetical protein
VGGGNAVPLSVPALDDRTYQQLVAEALRRIPVHNPSWNNFNDSDPGMTLLQLFAFMHESVLYRVNTFPERNRLKFLSLLGISLQPAAPATGLITIQNERGPLRTETVPANLEVRAGPTSFRTTSGLDVLPVEGRVFYKRKLADPQTPAEQAELETYRLLYEDLLDGPAVSPAFYASTPLAPPEPGDPAPPVVDLATETVDRCLWIALLARPRERVDAARAAIAGKALTIGVMPALAPEGVVLRPGQEAPTTTTGRLAWEIARPPAGGMLPTESSQRIAEYAPLDARGEVDVLAAPGLVEVVLPSAIEPLWQNLEPAEEGTHDFPPSLADTDLGERVVTWLRLRIPQPGDGAHPRAHVSWLGINAATIEQRVPVTGEVLGEGTGEPDQAFVLANTPVIPDSVTLTVEGDDDRPKAWSPIDDLLAAAPEVPISDAPRPLALAGGPGRCARPAELVDVFRLDPESGEVRFGDGAHGRRPQPGRRIVVSYAYGGGRVGNVGVGAINRAPELPAGFKATNPLRTWGGADREDQESAERRIPRVVKHRDRLVSTDDFHEVTWRTPGVELGRVEVLPLYDAEADLEGVPGTVTVVVVPKVDPLHPDAPEPDQLFLQTVCRYLQPRRLVTTELFVRGPIYRDLYVSVGVQVLSGQATGPVIEAVKQALRTFLSPLRGGRSGEGWPLGGPVLAREIEAIVARVDGVRLVQDDALLGGPTGGATLQIELRSLELPRLVGLAVQVGAPLGLDELRTAPSTTAPDSVPLPVVPDRC